MTTAFSLGLPTDIPWTRVCATEDLLDPDACDTQLSPGGRSSIAVFHYVPPDDSQTFPEYQISYLKVAVTLAGYQPLDPEIQGAIDWDATDVETIEGLTGLLGARHPCLGANVQVAVEPDRRQDVPLECYPLFLDFEPMKREPHDLAITRAGGTARSAEIFDVDADAGGGTGLGLPASYAGSGGGFHVGPSSSGSGRTERLDTRPSREPRGAGIGTERREAFGHSTQISQLDHLLDGHHLGTHRAVFFVQPRPYALEEPSGCARGLRPLEGIQELFLVVAAPRARPGYVVSVRLDTGHLIETDIIEPDEETEAGKRQQLIVTSRGLCGCPGGPAGGDDDDDGRVIITHVRDLPAWLGEVATAASPRLARRARLARTSLHRANRLGELVRQEMIRSFRDPRPDRGGQRFLDTDLFASQLASHVVRSRRGRAQLSRTLAQLVAQEPSPELERIVRSFAATLSRDPEHLTVGDLVRTAGRDLARLAKMPSAEVGRLRLALLGVPLRDKRPKSRSSTRKAA